MPSLSPGAVEFARSRLGSILILDIALLLRAEADSWWTAERVAATLRAGVEGSRHALEALGSRNLLDVRIGSDLSYRFAPWHESAAHYMTEIAEHPYEAREIVARAGGSAAERFANAFRIRKSDG